MVDAVDLAIHLITFVSVLVPIYFLVKVYKKAGSSSFIKLFFFLTASLVVLAIPHLLHTLELLGVDAMPNNPTAYLLVEHVGVVMIVICFAWFLSWFEKKFTF